MKKLVVLFLFLSMGCLFAEDPKIRFFGEMETKYEYSDMNAFSVCLRGGARYQYDRLQVITELETEYNACTNLDFFTFNINKSYFNYTLCDYANITIGRDSLDNIFESKTQYGSKFNGAALALDYAAFSIRAGAFIPGMHGYYAGCGQFQVQPFNFPIVFGYSLTFWDSQQETTQQFLVSQVSCRYSPTRIFTGVPLTLVGGWSTNNKADVLGSAYYVGIELGNPYPQNKHEWQVSLVAKKVEENAIPLMDTQSLICKGFSGQGIALEAIYAASDRLSLKGSAQVAWIDQNSQDMSNSYSIAATCKF